MATLKDFDSIRLGGNWPTVIDVSKISSHESYGIIVHTFYRRTEMESGYVQVRKHNKSQIIALVVFSFDDIELDDFWKDSEVIWDSRNQ